MSKLNLVAMSYDREKLLNALQRTNATEIKQHFETENTSPLTEDCENLRSYALKVETALSRLTSLVESYNKEHKIKSDCLLDGFEVSYARFMSARDMKDEMDGLVEKINSLYDNRKELEGELNRLRRTLSSAQIYSSLDSPLKVADTAHVKFLLGTMPSSSAEGAEENGLCSLKLLNAQGDETLIFAAIHKSVYDGTLSVLQEAGFTACPFEDEKTGKEVYNSLLQREQQILNAIGQNIEDTYALSEKIRDLKIYSDYLAFELEKASLSEKLRSTQTTFLLEAYVPKEAEDEVKAAVCGVTDAVYFEFSKPADDETPPTLLKNNKVVKNFEAVTNMYSPVSYKEFDPNTVMGIFYSIFLGFIMGDVGYGILMFLVGGAIYLKIKRDSGMKRLAGVFAVGGIFAIIWGFLFNSVFGLALPMLTVLPNAKDDMWSIMGIHIPAVLIISMLIGVVHLCVGYICKAVQCFRRKEVTDGIFDGLVWAIFTVGVGIAIVGFVEEFNLSLLAMVGGITAGATLLIAMLTAGRKEKLLGKFTKGFGAAYGVINFASDVLSYARLYGLMLSGAVIAQIISGYAVSGVDGGVGMIFSGNAFLIILGVFLLIVGHIFNLAIGLLGAYIHDARLQYVEFYGRFFEGEGELFTPLGSKHKYIYLNN